MIITYKYKNSKHKLLFSRRISKKNKNYNIYIKTVKQNMCFSEFFVVVIIVLVLNSCILFQT